MCYQNWVRSAVFTSVLLVFNFRQTAHYSCSTFMQNGQIPFPLHLLLPTPPLIWKSSAKSGKKSGKLWKQEIWFHAKMPNRPQPPPQQSCQKIFQRFRHGQIFVFSSAKNDRLFAHTLPSTTVLCSPPANCLQVVCSSITPSVNCRALATPQLETVQAKCQLDEETRQLDQATCHLDCSLPF